MKVIYIPKHSNIDENLLSGKGVIIEEKRAKELLPKNKGKIIPIPSNKKK